MPFGTALNAESTGSTNKRFTSYDRSAPTGLDYAINRTYDSKQGRFTQVDPIGMSAVSLAAPQTLNMYTYCGNDPINYVDPSGLFFGSFFRWLGKLIVKLFRSGVAKKIAIKFVVSFVLSGGNFGVAIRSVLPDILRRLGLSPNLTPSWNPNLPYPISFGGISPLSRYIIVNFISNKRLLRAINACIKKVFTTQGLIAIAFRAATRKRNGLLTLKNSQGTFTIETGVNFSTSNLKYAVGASLGYDELTTDLRVQDNPDGFTPVGAPGSTFSFRGGTYSNDPRRANYVAYDARIYSRLDRLLGSGLAGKQIHEIGHGIAANVGTAGDGAIDEKTRERADYAYPFQFCVEEEYQKPGSYK